MPIIEFPNYKFKAHLQILSVFILTDGEGNGTPLQQEIQPVHSEGDQPWDFFGRNDAKAQTPVLWPPHCKELTCWQRL